MNSVRVERSPLLGLCLGLMVSGSIAQELSREAWSMNALFHNEDCTEFFWTQPAIPAGKAGELIDRYVDQITDAGTTVLLCNTNARRTNCRSDAWEAFWDGYDSAGPDDQPFLAPLAAADIPRYRKGVDNMLTVHEQGIDYPARVIQRCRQRGVSPWITLRMNDCHNNDVPDHPFHGSFWKENPQFLLQGRTDYFARCLDYAHPEVRDFYKALIVETLERYDLDGLELDFMREPYVFSVGSEAAGVPVLTAWLREIRQLTTDAAARRGHPVRLGVRVPSRPETALGMGFDAVGWAKADLIDLLVVTPRWATLEFDLPMEQWRKLLGASEVTLAGGLEILYRPSPHASAAALSPDLATGAAVEVLSSGADAVYLFNYFHPAGAWLPVRRAMRSLDELLKFPRRVAVTYRDITVPAEKYAPPLPATGTELEFSLRLGPVTPGAGQCEVLCEFIPPEGAAAVEPSIRVNGQETGRLRDDAGKGGARTMAFAVPAAALTPTTAQVVRISCPEATPITVQRVEMSYNPQP